MKSLTLCFFSLGPSALFTPIGLGKALAGHVILSKNATDVTECMKLCMVTEQCRSFNFNERLKSCQVSGSTAEVQSLADQEGFNYYERASFRAISPKWVSSNPYGLLGTIFYLGRVGEFG